MDPYHIWRIKCGRCGQIKPTAPRSVVLVVAHTNNGNPCRDQDIWGEYGSENLRGEPYYKTTPKERENNLDLLDV